MVRPTLAWESFTVTVFPPQCPFLSFWVPRIPTEKCRSSTSITGHRNQTVPLRTNQESSWSLDTFFHFYKTKMSTVVLEKTHTRGVIHTQTAMSHPRRGEHSGDCWFHKKQTKFSHKVTRNQTTTLHSPEATKTKWGWVGCKNDNHDTQQKPIRTKTRRKLDPCWMETIFSVLHNFYPQNVMIISCLQMLRSCDNY